jgi:hypothetical protein
MPTISEEQWRTGLISEAAAAAIFTAAPAIRAVVATGTPISSGEIPPARKPVETLAEEITKLKEEGGLYYGVPSAGFPAYVGTIAAALLGLGVGGTAGKILGLFTGGGSISEKIQSAAGLLTGTNGSNNGGSKMTTGTSVDNGTMAQVVSGGTAVQGVPFGGVGVPEPPANMVAKAWKTKAFSYTKGEYWVYFWKLIDGRILCWNEAKREAKIWKPKKNMVLSQNPRLPDLLKFTRKANSLLFKLDKQADRARRQFGVVRVVHESSARKR